MFWLPGLQNIATLAWQQSFPMASFAHLASVLPPRKQTLLFSPAQSSISYGGGRELLFMLLERPHLVFCNSVNLCHSVL